MAAGELSVLIISITVYTAIITALLYYRYYRQPHKHNWLLHNRGVPLYCIELLLFIIWSITQYLRIGLGSMSITVHVYLNVLCIHGILITHVVRIQHITWLCAFNTYAYVAFNYKYDHVKFQADRMRRRGLLKHDSINSTKQNTSSSSLSPHCSNNNSTTMSGQQTHCVNNNKIQPHKQQLNAKHVNNYTELNNPSTKYCTAEDIMSDIVAKLQSNQKPAVSVRLIDIIPCWAVRHAHYSWPANQLKFSLIYMLVVFILVVIVDRTTVDIIEPDGTIRTTPGLITSYILAMITVIMSQVLLKLSFRMHMSDTYYIRNELLFSTAYMSVLIILHFISELVNRTSTFAMLFASVNPTGAIVTSLSPLSIVLCTYIYIRLSMYYELIECEDVNTVIKHQPKLDLRQIFRHRVITEAFHIYIRKCLWMRQYKLYFQLTQWSVKHNNLTKIQSQIQQHTYSIHINVFSNGQLVSQSFNAETSDSADDTIGLQSEHDKLCLELLHDARVIYTDYISHTALMKIDDLADCSIKLKELCNGLTDDHADTRIQSIATIYQSIRDTLNQALIDVYIPHFSQSTLYRSLRQQVRDSSVSQTAPIVTIPNDHVIQVSSPIPMQPVQPLTPLPPMMNAIEADARLHNNRLTKQNTNQNLIQTKPIHIRKHNAVPLHITQQPATSVSYNYDDDDSLDGTLMMPVQHVSLNTHTHASHRSRQPSYDSLNEYAEQSTNSLVADLSMTNQNNKQIAYNMFAFQPSLSGTPGIELMSKQQSITNSPFNESYTAPLIPVPTMSTEPPLAAVTTHDTLAVNVHSTAEQPIDSPSVYHASSPKHPQITLTANDPPPESLSIHNRGVSTRYQPSSRAITSYVHVKNSAYHDIAHLIQAQQSTELQQQINTLTPSISPQHRVPITIQAKSAVTIQPYIFDMHEIQQNMAHQFESERSRSPSRLAVR